ncbi:MAG: hypothetical protein HC822_02290, partial [Oscillochloris sp.]|nr:hypothetical protein [Oscillochloris sp.]
MAAATTPTDISTYGGSITADADLHFEVICQEAALTPQIRLNQQATARDALSRLRSALQNARGVCSASASDA